MGVVQGEEGRMLIVVDERRVERAAALPTGSSPDPGDVEARTDIIRLPVMSSIAAHSGRYVI